MWHLSDLGPVSATEGANKSEARFPRGTMVYLGSRGAQTALRGVRGGTPGQAKGQAKVRRYGSGLGVLNLKAVLSAISGRPVSTTTAELQHDTTTVRRQKYGG
jgi:hypothetical protein